MPSTNKGTHYCPPTGFQSVYWPHIGLRNGI